jgi:FlaA1/EpsC-like NDP-sugar epimerase
MNSNFLLKIFELSRIKKMCIQVFTDIFLVSFSFFLSMTIRLNDFLVFTDLNNWITLTFLIPITLLIFFFCGFYHSIIRFVSEKFFITVGLGIFLSSITMYLGNELLDIFMPRSIPFIYFNFLFLFTLSTRYLFKYVFLNFNFHLRKSIAIYGAGEIGRKLFHSLKESIEYNPLIFIDDDDKLINKKIDGIKIFRFDKSIKEIKKRNIKLVLLALPNISNSKRTKILNKLDKHNLAVKFTPNKKNIINENDEISDVNNISIYDILERKEIPTKINLIKKNIFNKTVLVTGCGGSIGNELCKQILNIGPKSLIYLDNSEYALYKIDRYIQSVIKNKNLYIDTFPILGSVQDNELLKSLFNKFKIETVYHTAAYKHVPLVEQNIIEGIKNNIFGTYEMAQISVLKKVKAFILISSDKAVRPTNYMGATKRMAELICQVPFENQSTTIFSIVRFGNVIGSSGSVIPLFAKQIEHGGPVTLTHRNITRYFMSIKEAVGLVIQAGAMSKNGDLFLLDMGKPKKILNLAKKMIRLYGKKPIIDDIENVTTSEVNSIKIKITGLRPGEKKYEELLLNEKSFKTNHPKIFKAREKSIAQQELFVLLKELKKFCIIGDLKKIKKILEKAPIEFDTTNNFSDENRL